MTGRTWLSVVAAAATAGFTALVSGAAQAGQPRPWQMNFQQAASPTMEGIVSLHNFLLIVITAICVLVMVLLLYCIVRFNKKANPTPANFTHNTKLEIAWTVIPTLILVAIAFPSMRLLYFMDRIEEPDLTIKAVGHQWFWTYEYPDHGISFQSLMKQDDELEPGEPRLLAVDNPLVLPVGANVQILTTAVDVIHAWAVPAFGLKKDSVPGRLNETWVRVTETGTYYGQCSELCGVLHGFMPITVEVVSQEEFEDWLEDAKERFAVIDTRPGHGDAKHRLAALSGTVDGAQ